MPTKTNKFLNMKKIAILLAIISGLLAACLVSWAAQGVHPWDYSKAEKAEFAAARTEWMQEVLELSGKQLKKLSKLNRNYADVLGEEKPFGKPVYGGTNGPFYDTPGRPHPGQTVSGEVAPAKVLKRRARYVKKLGKVLTETQFADWKTYILPLPGEK